MAFNTNLSTQRSAPQAGHIQAVSSFQRPSNTTAYAVDDVVFESGGGVILFENVGSSGVLKGATLVMADDESADFDLLLFDTEPTNFSDNIAIALASADLSKMIGVFSFADTAKADVGTNKTVYESTVRNPSAFTSDGGKLYGILVTRSAYTPSSNSVYALSLHIESDK